MERSDRDFSHSASDLDERVWRSRTSINRRTTPQFFILHRKNHQYSFTTKATAFVSFSPPTMLGFGRLGGSIVNSGAGASSAAASSDSPGVKDNVGSPDRPSDENTKKRAVIKIGEHVVDEFVTCHVCFGARNGRVQGEGGQEEEVMHVHDECLRGHKMHEVCAEFFLLYRSPNNVSCIFCTNSPDRAQGASLGIEYEVSELPNGSRPHVCRHIPGYVVAGAAYDRVEMMRRVQAYGQIYPRKMALLLSQVSGEPLGDEVYKDNLAEAVANVQNWGVTYEQIIDHEAFSGDHEALVATLDPAPFDNEWKKEIDIGFGYLNATFEEDWPGSLLFTERQGGKDVWMGMSHKEVVKWAKTGNKLCIPPLSRKPSSTDFVRAMVAHGVDLGMLVEFGVDPKKLIIQFDLQPAALVAWGLDMEIICKVLSKPTFKDFSLRPSHLVALLGRNNTDSGFTAWALPVWDVALFTPAVLSAMTDDDWLALDLTLPVLFGMGLPVANLPSGWASGYVQTPPSACLTTGARRTFVAKQQAPRRRHKSRRRRN